MRSLLNFAAGIVALAHSFVPATAVADCCVLRFRGNAESRGHQSYSIVAGARRGGGRVSR